MILHREHWECWDCWRFRLLLAGGVLWIMWRVRAFETHVYRTLVTGPWRFE